MQTQVNLVLNSVQAKDVIEEYKKQGFLADEIYLISFSRDYTETLTESMEGKQIGIWEEGVFTAFANLFRDRGDELRAKVKSMGFSKARAESLEQRLEEGYMAIIAKDQKVMYNDLDPDADILYHPYDRHI